MLLSDIHVRHIYLDPACEHTTPIKPKYVVVAAIQDEVIYGFLINSETPKFVASSPALAPCDVPLKREHYPFLRQRPISHVDFTRLYKFQAKHFSEAYGLLQDDDIVEFVRAVRNCPRLTPIEKRMILATVKRIMDNDGKE